MRLYKTPLGQWAGTKQDAKYMAGDAITTYKMVEVPTDKAGLLDFLNTHRVGNDQRRATISSAPAIEELQQPIAGHVDVEDQIAEADLAKAIRLSSHGLCRVQELLNKAKGEEA